MHPSVGEQISLLAHRVGSIRLPQVPSSVQPASVHEEEGEQSELSGIRRQPTSSWHMGTKQSVGFVSWQVPAWCPQESVASSHTSIVHSIASPHATALPAAQYPLRHASSPLQ
jgi:hypothetical protein